MYFQWGIFQPVILALPERVLKFNQPVFFWGGGCPQKNGAREGTDVCAIPQGSLQADGREPDWQLICDEAVHLEEAASPSAEFPRLGRSGWKRVKRRGVKIKKKPYKSLGKPW